MNKFLRRISELPLLYLNHNRRWGGLIFILLTMAAFFCFPFIEQNQEIFSTYSVRDPQLLNIIEENASFNNDRILQIGLESENVHSAESLSQAVQLADRLRKVNGVLTVIAPDSIGGEERGDSGIGDLPLFRRWFFSEDESCLILYVLLPQSQDNAVIKELESVVYSTSNTFIMGEAYSTYLNFYLVRKEVFRMFLLSALVILLVFRIITNRFYDAFSLLLSSLLPSIWMLALFPLFSLKLGSDSMTIPIITLGLSTTYSIHLYRHFVYDEDGNLLKAVEATRSIILFAGLTTIIGFFTMIFSHFENIVSMGWLLMLATTFSLISSLFFLPWLLQFRRKTPLSKHRSRIEIFTNVFRYGKWNVFAFFLIYGCIILGLSHFFYGGISKNPFKSGTQEFDYMERGLSHYSDYGEMVLIFDFGDEYSFVDIDVYREFSAYVNRLEGNPQIENTFHIGQFVNWGNAVLAGDISGYLVPEDEFQLGETLEFLIGMNEDAFIESLINVDYSRIRLRIQYDKGLIKSDEYRNYRIFKQDLLQWAEESSLPEPFFAGDETYAYRFLEVSLRDQLLGIGFFILLISYPIYRKTRSKTLTLIALSSPVLGALAYLGLHGLLGVPYLINSLILFPAVLGISIDDALVFILCFMRQIKLKGLKDALLETYSLTGTPIIQTTLLITLTLGPLLGSHFTSFPGIIRITILTFLICTSITLLVLPVLIYYYYQRKLKKGKY